MSITKPKFVDSPYFKVTGDGWELENGAPEDIKEEFEEYMEYENELKKRGIEL